MTLENITLLPNWEGRPEVRRFMLDALRDGVTPSIIVETIRQQGIVPPTRHWLYTIRKRMQPVLRDDIAIDRLNNAKRSAVHMHDTLSAVEKGEIRLTPMQIATIYGICQDKDLKTQELEIRAREVAGQREDRHRYLDAVAKTAQEQVNAILAIPDPQARLEAYFADDDADAQDAADAPALPLPVLPPTEEQQ